MSVTIPPSWPGPADLASFTVLIFIFRPGIGLISLIAPMSGTSRNWLFVQYTGTFDLGNAASGECHARALLIRRFARAGRSACLFGTPQGNPMTNSISSSPVGRQPARTLFSGGRPPAAFNGSAISVPARLRADPPCWRWSSTQLEPGPLRLIRNALHFDGISLCVVSTDRVSLHRLRAPADHSSLLLRARDAAPLFIGGHELGPDAFWHIAPGREFELIAHRNSRFLLISLPADRSGRPRGPPAPEVSRGQGNAEFLSCPIGSTDKLGCIARTVPWDIRSTHTTSAAECLRQTAIALLCGPAAPFLAPVRQSAPGLQRARRGAAVELARQYIHGHLAEPLHLSDLCIRVHMQARSLEYGFQEVARLSPMRYVKMLRLAQVRRELLQGGRAERSISEIALDAGFAHLSQFAADYRRVFCESPSASRQRALWPRHSEGR